MSENNRLTRNVADFIFGTDDEIAAEVMAMSDEEVSEELSASGLDDSEKFNELMEKIRGQYEVRK